MAARKKPTARSSRRQGAGTSPRRRRSRLGRLVYWSAILGIWALVALAGVIAWYGRDLPRIDDLTNDTRQPGLTVIAADGSVIASYGEVYAGRVQLEQLPPLLPAAFLATEDRRFYSHPGIDLIGIGRALFANLGAGRVVQGGSTISQQIAKNIFLSPERSLRRKVQEALLALSLEHRYSKPQLLTIYLNRVYFGAGAYGVEAAARRYFGKPASQVELAEAAMLAGLVKAPSRYAPTRDLALAQTRAAEVLDNMVEAGVITPAQANNAKRAPASARGTPGGSSGARYFADWVVEQLADYLGAAAMAQDLLIQTTLDPALQRAAESAVEQTLAEDGLRRDVSQAALVAMTPDGAVRAMVGGRAYAQSQFNRASQSRRQPGSAFKLFVYLAALEAGFDAEDIFADAPIQIAGWAPSNYDGRYQGDITLGEAFARSSNSVAVQLAERVGRMRVVEVARRLGLAADWPLRPSLALGAGEVTLVELTAAYAVIANRGRAVLAHGIVEIRDRAGRSLYRRAGSGPGAVLAPAIASAMDALLRRAVTNGTGGAAALEVRAAGKTGTSQDFRDAWFVGYRPGLVAGVWVGNDDGKPMDRVTGGGLPARLWRAVMRTAGNQP